MVRKREIKINLNEVYIEKLQSMADNSGLSIQGLINVIILCAAKSGKISGLPEHSDKDYDQFIREKISNSASSELVSPEDANKRLGFTP